MSEHKHLIENYRAGGEGAGPSDTLLHVIPNVTLSGGAFTLTLDEYKKNGLNVSYSLAKQTTFNASGQVTVNTTAIGATDTVTVLLWIKANELR